MAEGVHDLMQKTSGGRISKLKLKKKKKKRERERERREKERGERERRKRRIEMVVLYVPNANLLIILNICYTSLISYYTCMSGRHYVSQHVQSIFQSQYLNMTYT